MLSQQSDVPMLTTVKSNVDNCKVGCWFNTLILITVKFDVDNGKVGC